MYAQDSASHRTDAKLKYARVHLEELRNHNRRGTGDDFERAHQESFLYHLLGAIDAFLQELNGYYDCGLSPSRVRRQTLSREMEKRGVTSLALKELDGLASNSKSWLSVAKELRDHVTHRKSVTMKFFVGGERDGEVEFEDPRTRNPIRGDILDAFELWQTEMETLLSGLREGVIKQAQKK